MWYHKSRYRNTFARRSDTCTFKERGINSFCHRDSPWRKGLVFSLLAEKVGGAALSILKRIEALCDSRNITVYQLEKETGLAQSTIKKWENATPTCKALSLVADYFDVSVDYLLGRSDNLLSHKNECSKLCIALSRELDSFTVPDEQIEPLCEIIKSILTNFK